jgi:UDP-glucose 4-epimerase
LLLSRRRKPQPIDMKKRVVVTGASGFLGRSVVTALAACGADVLPVARAPIRGGVEVCNYGDAPEGEVLVHLAEDNDRARVRAAGAKYEIAVQRTLEALVAKGYETIVYASSALLYCDVATTRRRTTDPVYTIDPYTRVKKRSEDTVIATGAGIAVRLANLYGPGMAHNNVLNTILGQIPGSGPVTVMDDSPVRDFTHVFDAAAAIGVMALKRGAPGIYNVGTGQGSSVRELARVALEIAGERWREVVATHAGAHNSRIVLDISDTTATWGWTPQWSLAAGLTHLMNCKRG